MYKGLGKALPKTAGESLRNRVVLPQLILAKPEAPKPELMRTQADDRCKGGRGGVRVCGYFSRPDGLVATYTRTPAAAQLAAS